MPRTVVREIETRLGAMVDPERATHAQGFFKTGPGEYGEGDVFLGIRVPPLRKLAREFRDIETDHAFELLASKFHEQRLLALLILNLQFARADASEQRDIYTRYLKSTAHINNWDLVDSSAHIVVGGYLDSRSRKPLYRLARSKLLWERRISMIATYHFIRQGDFEDALAIAGLLVQDEHDLIHKAVGWMLREVGNRDFVAEERFLRQHYRTMPRTMLRYAIEKFPEKRRKAWLEGRIR